MSGKNSEMEDVGYYRFSAVGENELGRLNTS
jgi:hypothetical protein